MMRAQTRHPLDPLSAAEISVAVATVRAAGATPEVCIILLRLSVWLMNICCRWIIWRQEMNLFAIR